MDLCHLINEIISDFKNIYLIEKRNLNVYAKPHVLRQPELAVRIALKNLIRNAFQHSTGDEIQVIQMRGTVKIINSLMPSYLDPADTGFGLGRELIARLTDKLGKLKFMSNDSHHVAIVKFD